MRSGSASSSARRPGVDDAARVEHDDVLRDPPDDGEVLLDEQHGRELRGALERGRDLGHEQRREPLRRLVDEQHRVLVQERARDRDHLLLAARERAGSLRRRASELGKELVDELVPRRAVPLGEPQVLVDRQAGEDVAVLGDVADPAADDRVRGQPRQLLAGERDAAACAARARAARASSSSCRRRSARAAP